MEVELKKSFGSWNYFINKVYQGNLGKRVTGKVGLAFLQGMQNLRFPA